MMRRLLSISLMLFLLASCRSHKATVIRPSANAECRVDKIQQSGKNIGQNQQSGTTDIGARDVDARLGARLVSTAREWLGVPYRYGGETKSGVDCSGMTMVVYRDVAGVKLPRSSAEQCEYCIAIPRWSLQPGDLVFFSSSKGGHKVSHVGMYMGDGKIIHASTSRGVIESDMSNKYYDAHYHSSGRVPGVSVNSGKKAIKTPGTAMQTGTTAKTSTVKEMTLDEFVNKPETNKQDSVGVLKSVDRPDAAHATAAKPDSVYVTKSPTVIIDGVRQATVHQPVPRDSAAVDSVRRADEIRRDVTKAMRFGK